MIYNPETYRIPDERLKPFIDPGEIWDALNSANTEKSRIRSIIQSSLNKKRLSLQETADLVMTTDPELVEEILEGARILKEKIYGERIVLFAPLYVGDLCTNNCTYCGFRASNTGIKRVTLSTSQLEEETKALIDQGHKRLILVYGEHPRYSADFIAATVKAVYSVKHNKGEIRRLNINAAPFDVEGFRVIKDAAIGTYQIFQETYDPETYAKVHPSGQKSNYNWRLTALDRAQEAGIDDVGIGALFGLYDWRFEVLGLIRHVNHLEAVYHVGPHTISFPRVQNAMALDIDKGHLVSNDDFVKLVAILRLAVPYTGMILTAREPSHIRDQVLRFGVSQIDGGTNIELGGYSKGCTATPLEQDLSREQFQINDTRSLNEIMNELIRTGYIPSFCTACYRLDRTGEHFMEFTVPGFIKRFCSPNALLTLAEYLEDYAPEETKVAGYRLIDQKVKELALSQNTDNLKQKLHQVKEGKRDLYF